MANVTLKGIPDDLYERIKQEAAENHRSLNSEIIHRLARSARAPAVDPDRFLRDLARTQERLSMPPLTDDLLRSARDEGRP